jgi:GTP cyclohydrolase II
MILASTILTTRHGELAVNYHSSESGECVTLATPGADLSDGTPLVRIHSSCLFSEAFGSDDCDCRLQLDSALQMIVKEPGAVVYLYQEGRGHGLAKKIAAMEQERANGLDTHDAFIRLGLDLDPRTYDVALTALEDINVSKAIRLMSNNPKKHRALKHAGYSIAEVVRPQFEVSDKIKRYLDVKKSKFGHDIDFQT